MGMAEIQEEIIYKNSSQPQGLYFANLWSRGETILLSF